MRLLELFSGTHSIGKVAKIRDIDVISLDRDLGHLEGSDINNHIKEDILNWDYKVYPSGYFDIITASPVCVFWSILRSCWIGRKCKTINPDGSIVTMKDLERDINQFGKPMVDTVFKILDYFKPKYWWVENPQTGKMKRYIEQIKPDVKWVDVDYCKYGFEYKKRTRFWISNSLTDFIPKLCKKDCGSMIMKDNINIHKKNIGSGYIINEKGELELCNTKKLRDIRRKKLKNVKKNLIHKKDVSLVGGSKNKLERYRIPSKLIEELLDICKEEEEEEEM